MMKVFWTELAKSQLKEACQYQIFGFYLFGDYFRRDYFILSMGWIYRQEFYFVFLWTSRNL